MSEERRSDPSRSGDSPARRLAGAPRAPKLLDRLAHALRVRHYSPRTEHAYRYWVRRYILFHGKRHPDQLGAAEIEAFLNHLAVDGHVAASTQNQALNAVVFLYRRVLLRDLPQLEHLIRARKPRRLPVVLTPREVRDVLDAVRGTSRLVAALLYGSGLRLLECLELRTSYALAAACEPPSAAPTVAEPAALELDGEDAVVPAEAGIRALLEDAGEGAARTVELLRRDGTLAGRYVFRGTELVAFQLQAEGPLARRVSHATYARLLAGLDEPEPRGAPVQGAR